MASSRRKGDDFKQEHVLQAVVIADSFNVRFAPVTKTKPRTLLPLANIPLLEYTLEFLCSAGIQEVIVFCCAHAQQIKGYLANSQWTRSSCPMDLTTIVSENCLSVGDALRDIDAKSLISNDFVLVNGDVISNVKLKPIIEAHKARRLKDKTPIMTLLFKTAPPGHMTRCKEEEVVIAVKPENNRVLSYQKLGSMKKFDFPVEIFSENKSVQLRYDLLDTQICICSPHVPQLFTDNFDYLSSDDFVRGILVSEEILGNTIHVHILEAEYAARVSNLHMYDSISKDVLNRWVYPMVPDNAVTDHNCDKYTYGRHNIYLHRDVSLARQCTLNENVLIGRGSTVGSNSCISHSVIGQNCTIGEHVKLEGAYIWDGVTVEDHCVLTTCVLDSNVHLKKNVKVLAGCVIGSDVVIGPGVTLTPGTMLMSEPPEDDFEEEDTEAVIDTSLVGVEGRGYVYEAPTESDDEEVEHLVQDVWGLRIESEEEDSASVFSESDGDEGAGGSPIPDETKLFFDEVLSTLERALVENINEDNMILEINSVKHAYGIQIKEVNQLLTKALMQLPLNANPSLESASYLTQTKKNLKKFLPLLQNYIRSAESQLDCLLSLEEFSLATATGLRVLGKVLHLLYEEDILSEDVLINWYNDPRSSDNSPELQKLKKQVEPFITWLKEAEEESDD